MTLGPAQYPENWEIGKEARMEHWRRVREARNDFTHPDVAEFYKHLTEVYGLKVKLDSHLNITGDFDIVDEQKYSLFLLKYL